MSKVRNLTRAAIGAAAFAAVFATTLPAVPAYAIDTVPCNSNDYLRIMGRTPISNRKVQMCFANGGTAHVDLWVDQISTGNNDIEYLDYNGARVRIKRWRVVNFPNRPPHVRSVTIL